AGAGARQQDRRAAARPWRGHRRLVGSGCGEQRHFPRRERARAVAGHCARRQHFLSHAGGPGAADAEPAAVSAAWFTGLLSAELAHLEGQSHGRETMKYVMTLLAFVVAAATVSGQSAATNPLMGAWKVDGAQPGLYIFAKQHY